ncbi:MAG: SGNH/GDSL hydrolase family protein [Acetobacteraceae bacterium]|nr:SGNH/GDSL hydrolase family protein [Acetobacteraceae bacterium]
MRNVLVAIGCAGLLLAPPGPAGMRSAEAGPAPEGAVACGAPAELLRAQQPLGGMASGIAAGRLRILAVGSASVHGPGGSGEAAAWPNRLEALLRERLPGVRVEVQVRGGRGLTTTDQWALIAEVLKRGPRPDLVIWQAGATEVARGLPVEALTEGLLPGLDRLHTLGVDTVVMDLQFSRFLRAHADVTAYREALAIAAAGGDAPLFPRYELMQAWAEAERVDLERTPRDRRTAAVDMLNDCIARALAEFLLSGVQEARR